MEFSNKSLAWLVIAAIVISITGTILSINSLSMTGYVTNINATGNASVSITTQTALIFSVPSLIFGSGSVNGSGGYNCTLSINKSTSPNITRVGGCEGFNATNANGVLMLENSGNTIINVTLTFNANSTDFIGGGSLTQCGGPCPLPQFKFNVAENEIGSCNSIQNTTWTNVIENTSMPICNGMNYADSTDTLDVGIYVVIPSDTPQGDKTVTITAQGTG